MNPLVLRTEVHVEGHPIEVYGECLVPMTASAKKWLVEEVGIGDHYEYWKAVWWQGYNQSPMVDVYPMTGNEEDDEYQDPFQVLMDVYEYPLFYQVLSDLHEDQEFYIKRAIDWETPEE